MSNAAAVRAGRAYVELFTDDSRLTAGLKAAVAKMKAFGQSVQAVGQKMVGIGAAAALPVGYAVKRFADFDDAMRATKGTTRATEAEFQSLTELARKLGRETSFTAIEVANLMLNLGRAGFNSQQIEGMTAAVMDLARATGTDAALAAKIVGTSIRQFKLEASDAARVADTLTAAANNSNNTVESLGDALSYAGPVAKQFGYTIEETAAIIGTLANSGIEASAAGTAIRRLLTITGAESDKLKTIFKVDFKDINGNARNLVDVLGDVARSTEKMGSAARAEKFNEAFGLLGITGANVIGSSVADTKKLFETIKAAGGVARETAKQMDSGLGGAIRITLSAMDDAVMGIGEHLAPALMLMGTALQDGSKAFRKWADENKLAIAIVGTAVVATVAMGAALVGVGIALKVAAFALGTFTALAGSVRLVSAAVMGVVTTVRVLNAALVAALSITKLTSLALAGVGAVVLVLKASVLALFAPLTLIVGAIGGVGYAFIGASKEGERARAAMGQSWQGIKTAAVSAWQGISDAVASGDMGLAMQIAGKALQVVWLNIVAGLKGAWLEFTGFLESTLLTVGAALVKVWANIVAGMKSIWLELTNAVGTLADGAKDAGRSLVQIDPKKVEALRAERKALDGREGPNVEKRKAELDDLLKRVDDLKKPAGEKRQQEMEAKRAEIGKELQDREKGVDDRLAGQKRDIEDRNKGRVADLMKEAVDAQKELDKLNADAKAKREGKVAPGGDKRDALGAAIGGLGLVGVDLLKKAEPLGLGGGATGPAEGTFSALATRGLGGDNIQTKQLQELEKLVENGKKQLDALKGAGLVAK